MPNPRVLPGAALPLQNDPVKYQSNHNPSVIVEVIAEAELRIGETRRQAIVYTRNGRNYVRPKAEFLDKFSLVVSAEPK